MFDTNAFDTNAFDSNAFDLGAGGGTVGKAAVAKSVVYATHSDGWYRSYTPISGKNQALPANARLLAASSEWYRDITALALHLNSGNYLTKIGAGYAGTFWPAGFYRYENVDTGAPYVVVDIDTQPLVPVVGPSFKSDIAWAPIPLDIKLIQEWEAGERIQQDRHVLVLAMKNGAPYRVYGLWHAWLDDVLGGWRATAYAVYDCTQGDGQRPYQWTGADVMGTGMLQGMVRADELISGTINHAIRWTQAQQSKEGIWPATHHVFYSQGANGIPVGLRMRLKASFDRVTAPNSQPWHPYARAMLDAAAKYGIIASDGGISMMMTGDTQLLDPDASLFIGPLRTQVNYTHFDVVDTGYPVIDLWTNPPAGTGPTLAVTNSVPEVAPAGSSTIGWTASNYNRLSTAPFGGIQTTGAGSAIVTPARTTWYDVQAYNLYGQQRFMPRVIVTGDTARRSTVRKWIGPTTVADADGSYAKPYSIAEYVAQVQRGDESEAYKWSGIVIGFKNGSYDLSALAAYTGFPICLPIIGGIAGYPTVWQSETAGSVTFALGSSALSVGQWDDTGFVEAVDINITGGTGPCQWRFYNEFGPTLADYGGAIRLDNLTCTGLAGTDANVCTPIYFQRSREVYVRGCTVASVTAPGGATPGAVGLQVCDNARIRGTSAGALAIVRDYGSTNTVID